MDCNRDEAERAKNAALELFNKKEYISARNLAVKAQALNPDLENITKMIATIDVYISSKKNEDEVVDWYKVLNLDPSADEITIRKQYLRLALVLHPDKNKSVDNDSATEAFKFIQQAYSELSSTELRRKYDKYRLKRDLEEQHKREQVERFRREQEEILRREQEEQIRREQHEQHSVSVNAQTEGYLPDGFFDFGYETNLTPDAPAQSNGGSKTSTEPKARSNTRSKATKRKATRPPQDTFWTICNRCMYQYEFATLYLNGMLLCDNCKNPFLAYETTPPGSYPHKNVPRQQN